MASPVFKCVGDHPNLSRLVPQGPILLRFRRFGLPPNPTENQPVLACWFAKCLQTESHRGSGHRHTAWHRDPDCGRDRCAADARLGVSYGTLAQGVSSRPSRRRSRGSPRSARAYRGTASSAIT